MKTLVLGLGNELFGDDGVGIHVIRQLKKKKDAGEILPGTSHVVFEECSLSGIAILDVLVGYDRLVIIDTIKKENPVTGRISILEEKNLRHIPGPSPHYVSIPQTIEIGRSIGLEMPSKIKIVAVEAKNLYNLGEGLTKEMTQAVSKIVRKVTDLIAHTAILKDGI